MAENSQSPKQTPWSDIDLDRWREYDEIKTDSLWLYDSRASGAGHQLDYHGNYIPQIATQILTRYSKRQDIVLDLFLGSGTSAIEAMRLGRRCIGVELKPELVKYVGGKIDPELLESQLHLLQGDSADGAIVPRIEAVLRQMDADFVQLLILHPPYADIIRFSDHGADLSNAPSITAFLDGFETVAQHGFQLLAPGRFAALIIGDKYAQGELVPLGFWCMERMNRIGFKTKAIIVKNIEGNEKGKGKNANLWRYRALAGGYYIFKHEYIILFFKPNS
ncbi:MAG: DNA methyltransferase [Anaerolineae bacterium]|nr:DNA methyltransferase [Anaerolineae bacterium]